MPKQTSTSAKKKAPAKSTNAAPKAAAPRRRRRAAANTQWFIRNVRTVPVSIRFTDTTNRRVELKPRGERGDLSPVSKEEMNDSHFTLNEHVLFERLTTAEAQAVLEKQTINQQAAHPALSQLRNSLGEEYKSGVRVEPEFEKQGVVVAQLKDGQVVIDRGGIQRSPVVGSQENPIGQSNEEIAKAQSLDALGLNVSVGEAQPSPEV